MSSAKSHNAENIIKRIMEWYSLANEDEVAEKLSLSRSTLSSQKTRNSLDLRRVAEYCYDSDLNYIINGSQNAENSAIRANDDGVDYLSQQLAEFEIRANEIINKVENGPWSPQTKLKMIESMIHIAEEFQKK